MKRFGVLAWLWVGVLLATGLAGGLVVSRVGWSLAMALSIYAGDTEPVRPDLAFPWWVFGLATLVSVIGLGWATLRKRQAAEPGAIRAFVPLGLAYLAGLLAAVLPFVQLYRLWSVTG